MRIKVGKIDQDLRLVHLILGFLITIIGGASTAAMGWSDLKHDNKQTKEVQVKLDERVTDLAKQQEERDRVYSEKLDMFYDKIELKLDTMNRGINITNRNVARLGDKMNVTLETP